jgi:hypothetical protein
MDMIWKVNIWNQFGAALEMLDNALAACPDELWQARLYVERQLPDAAAYWYIAYHCIFWLDYYLAETDEGFAPPPPFTLSEFDPDGALPERVYTKAELRAYLRHGRDKCRARIEGLTDPAAPKRVRLGWRDDMTFVELLLYNMRHVQEHAAQLSLFLGQRAVSAPGWVSRPK